MDPRKLNSWLEDSGALRRGHFRLSSGLHSPAYVQCALLLQDPARARDLGTALADRVREFAPDSILSPALGGILIGHEVAAALAVPFRFAERVGKVMRLRRGFSLRRRERVAIIEDVITTGGSAREAADVVGEQGAQVVAFGSILSRAGEDNPFAAPLATLIALDLPTYTREDCPQCAAGQPAVKPGSHPSPD